MGDDFDPLALWNSHYVRQLNDGGSISSKKRQGYKAPPFIFARSFSASIFDSVSLPFAETCAARVVTTALRRCLAPK
jgi:hypothetical protein